MAHFIHDDKNNRIEGMSKEEIYALLAEAIQEGQLPSVDEDTAFVTMIKSIVDGNPYKIGFCTQAQYNAMEAGGTLEANALYIITDDTSYDDLIALLTSLQNDLNTLDGQVNTNTNNIQDILNALSNKVDISKWVDDFRGIINNAGGVEIRSYSVDDDFGNSYDSHISIYPASVSVYYSKKRNGAIIEEKEFDIFEKIETLENKHLYRHDFTLAYSSGGAYVVYFSLYLATANQITTFSDLMSYIGTYNHINAGGYFLRTSTSDVGSVNYISTLGDLNSLNVNASYINNGVLDTFGGTFTASNVVISDKVKLVY